MQNPKHNVSIRESIIYYFCEHNPPEPKIGGLEIAGSVKIKIAAGKKAKRGGVQQEHC